MWRGWDDSIAGGVLVLHVTRSDLIHGTTYGSQSPPGMIYEWRVSPVECCPAPTPNKR